MVKVIKYKYVCGEVNHGTEEKPVIEHVLCDAVVGWNEVNEETAKREAYNGEYTIEDDGVEEVIAPTTEERVEALEAAVTMLCMPDASEV